MPSGGFDNFAMCTGYIVETAKYARKGSVLAPDYIAVSGFDHYAVHW
jgi:hypothetical protein